MKILKTLTLITLIFFGAYLSANDDNKPENLDLVLDSLLEIFPGIESYSLDESEIDGLYTVSIGSEVIYLSKDGRFLIRGEILDLQSSINLTEERRVLGRVDLMQKIDESSMIIYEPDKIKHTVTIFTDIDCGYCRKFHESINNYLDLGIRVRYLSFPRTGPNTISWEKAELVWCSDDRNVSLDRAKKGKRIDSQECQENPVEYHYDLGSVFNISGTPTIVTDQGTLIVGYLPPESLLSRLQNDE